MCTFAKKIPVYCYDFDTGKFLMEFGGMRIMGRILGKNSSNYIIYKILLGQTQTLKLYY